AHRLCAGDALFADRNRGIAMIVTGNSVWHWGTIRSFACRLLSRQRPEHRVDGRVHALEIGRTIGWKDPIEADRVRQSRFFLRLDDREAERLEYFARQDPAMHPAAEAYRLGRKKHVLADRRRLAKHEVAGLTLEVGQRQAVVLTQKSTLDPGLGAGWPKQEPVVDDVDAAFVRRRETFELGVDKLRDQTDQRKGDIADRDEQRRSGHVRGPQIVPAEGRHATRNVQPVLS